MIYLLIIAYLAGAFWYRIRGFDDKFALPLWFLYEFEELMHKITQPTVYISNYLETRKLHKLEVGKIYRIEYEAYPPGADPTVEYFKVEKVEVPSFKNSFRLLTTATKYDDDRSYKNNYSYSGLQFSNHLKVEEVTRDNMRKDAPKGVIDLLFTSKMDDMFKELDSD